MDERYEYEDLLLNANVRGTESCPLFQTAVSSVVMGLYDHCEVSQRLQESLDPLDPLLEERGVHECNIEEGVKEVEDNHLPSTMGYLYSAPLTTPVSR